MAENDLFGGRMKEYEGTESQRRFMKLLPIMARIDGRKFSNFTRNMERPYDLRMTNLMIATTKYLVKETNANCGYTQSDEISLTWYSPKYDSQVFFDGRVQKMTSQLAALATGFFNDNFESFFGTDYKRDRIATFDARTWQVPNLTEGANTFLWREQDATKNSISMATRSCYSANEMMHKNGSEMQEMLWRKGINWSQYPQAFKRGTFVQRRTVRRKFSPEEVELLPKQHQYFRTPDMEIERSEIRELNMPPFGTVTNRPEVIYFGEEPAALKGAWSVDHVVEEMVAARATQTFEDKAVIEEIISQIDDELLVED